MRHSVFLLLLLCTACASRQAPNQAVPASPVPENSPSANFPSPNIPSPNIPSPNFPQAEFPDAQFPKVQFPDVQFPIAQFPEVQFPEVTFPDVRIQQGEGLTVMTLPADVLFDFDQDTIRPDAEAALRQIRQVIRRYPDQAIEIRGHTDAQGDDAYNQALSERRSTAVKRWFGTQGQIPEAQMTTRGFGETQPVAPNTQADGSDDPQGRQQNRRVEIVIRSQS